MSISLEVKELHQKLTVVRSEIHNLRKQLNTLRHIHSKDINKILTKLKNLQDCKCSNNIPSEQQNASMKLPLANSFDFKPIGIISSPFPRIRGTPRQPSVTMHNATATLKLNKDIFTNPSHSLQDLEQFSHLWVIFVFHKHDNGVKAKVAPPRLNGEKTGVFATRSPHRPCPIGLSLVKIERIVEDVIYFSGVDMVDGTPVLDVKPFIPQYDQPNAALEDRISDDHSNLLQNERINVQVPSWINESPVHKLRVSFDSGALEELWLLEPKLVKERIQLITQVLHEDPRSVYLRKRLGSSHYVWKIEHLSVECAFDDAKHLVEVLKIYQQENDTT